MPISPIWPAATAVNAEGSIEFHGRTAESLLDEFGSPLYLIDTDEVVARARHFVRAAAEAFNTSTTHVSFAGKAFLSKEVVRLVTEAGMFVDTCTMGEMKIALAAGVPGRRLVLHGNNKSDEEIALAIEQGFAKIVIDEPDEPERVAAIARKLGKRARVMLRVTVGVHAGGHEYISTAHEDQKFGVPLLAAGADAEVGFYHIGGVRLDSIAAGGVGVARVYDLEPFGTQVARMEMTPAEMRRMIVTKYNEPTREGHRIDLVSTTPYAILVDAEDRAFDVRFPELREDRRYKVAVSDYVYRNYHDLHCTEGEITGEKVADILIGELREDSPLEADNAPRQKVVRTEAKKF